MPDRLPPPHAHNPFGVSTPARQGAAGPRASVPCSPTGTSKVSFVSTECKTLEVWGERISRPQSHRRGRLCIGLCLQSR